MNFQRTRIAGAFTALWLGTALLVATKRLIKLFPWPGAELNSDAFHVYLPNARQLLHAPWQFLSTDPASYHVAPLGYFWAALWGANHALIELANCILFLLCIVLMWRCAKCLGGLVAAAVCSALLAVSPMLEWTAQVLTEPLYLFGLMLGLRGGIEYALGSNKPRWMLAQFSAGLAITLLARPILQFFTLAAVLLVLLLLAWGIWRKKPALHAASRPWAIALLCAALLPAAVVLKNGLCFQVWGLGTGAGTGLYYGVNPLRLGVEPVYTGFSYDAANTPATALGLPAMHPLSREADQINAQIALQIVRNTTWADNAAFFWHKIKSWLFFSTQELHINSRFRRNRSMQWLLMGTAAALVLWRRWRGGKNADLRWPGDAGSGGSGDVQRKKMVICGVLLLLACGMAAQLTPVLYNMRYNLFAVEPWLLLLCGISAALVLQKPPTPARWHGQVAAYGAWLLQTSAAALARGSGIANAHALHIATQPEHGTRALRWHLQWPLQKAALLLALVWLATALTGRAIRHENHAIDPYRPGPVQVVLGPENFGHMHSIAATDLGGGRWQLQHNPATVFIPLHIAADLGAALPHYPDALWRMRFALDLQGNGARTCRQARVAVSNPRHTHQVWHEPPALLDLRSDGRAHTYAIHGNYSLRPSGDSELALTFFCPPGTVMAWHGADLLQSALAQAARAWHENGTPINPYYRHDPPP